MMQRRMRSLYAKDVEVIGMPQKGSELKKIQPFEFQNWVVERLHGRINPRKSSGDFFSPIVSTIACHELTATVATS
jgi:hypothetical protein